jgi:replicative DNA helicase
LTPENVTFDFSQHLQDCLLILAIFDKDVTNHLSAYVNPQNFISDLSRFVCSTILDYYKKYQEAPGEHFGDILLENLQKVPEEKIKIIIEYVHKLYEIFPNKEYVLNNLSRFIRYNNIIKGIIDGSKLVEAGKYPEAKQIITDAFQVCVPTQEEGIDYLIESNKRAEEAEIICKTQIDALDKLLYGFSRKELIVWLASTGIGKSWSMIHCAKVGMMQKLKVLYYTLEMSPEWVATRVDMGLMGMGTKETVITLPHMEGETYIVKNIFNHNKELEKKLQYIRSLGGRLLIRGTPTGGLTLSKLKMDLDILEVTKNFIPDMIIVDYADLMQPETVYNQFRHNLAAIYTGLRQIALERNCVMITASQSNRASMGAQTVSLQHFAEDIQKANISDVVLSLCQTDNEKALNKMRIYCCKNRNWVVGFQIENWYSYIIGQFSLYSRLYEVVEKELDKTEGNMLQYNTSKSGGGSKVYQLKKGVGR